MTDKNQTLQAGCLYVVGMPLGNLGDISTRAKEVLEEVDLIACEDTRVTALTLSQLGIKKRLISYHEHNQAKRGPELLALLLAGEKLALVSDAGMPAISDPGEALVALVAEAGQTVSVIPGPTAAMTALAASGLDSRRFVFEGFLPVKGRSRREAMDRVAGEASTVILYEAPHRMERTLEDLIDAGLGDRRIVAGRELTKRYEEYLRFDVTTLLAHLRIVEARGEFTLILEGRTAWTERTGGLAGSTIEDRADEIRALIRRELAAGATQRSLTAVLVNDYGFSKNTAYDWILAVKEAEL